MRILVMVFLVSLLAGCSDRPNLVLFDVQPDLIQPLERFLRVVVSRAMAPAHILAVGAGPSYLSTWCATLPPSFQ